MNFSARFFKIKSNNNDYSTIDFESFFSEIIQTNGERVEKNYFWAIANAEDINWLAL